MRRRLAIHDRSSFLFFWVGVSVLGWLLIPINTLYPELKTYWDVANRGLAYAACGLLIGLITGIGQFLVINRQLCPPKKWFALTLAGYTLAWPIGLAISTLIPAIAFAFQGESFLPLSQPGAVTFSPFPSDIVFGGWVVGMAQWAALRQILPYQNSRLGALWTLGVWFSLGLGIFVTQIGRSIPLDTRPGIGFDLTLALERAIIGGMSGLVVGLLLLFVIRQVAVYESDEAR